MTMKKQNPPKHRTKKPSTKTPTAKARSKRRVAAQSIDAVAPGVDKQLLDEAIDGAKGKSGSGDAMPVRVNACFGKLQNAIEKLREKDVVDLLTLTGSDKRQDLLKKVEESIKQLQELQKILRACYALSAINPAILVSMRQVNATKCSPAKVDGMRS